MRISIVAVEDVFDTGLASLLDTFETANEVGNTLRFEVEVVGVRTRVRTHHGALVPTTTPTRAPDLAILPALACKQPDTIVAALGRPDVADVIDLLTHWHTRGTRLAAACTGTFVLACTGVLDGRRATTTWWLGPAFRNQFPQVELEEHQMLVTDRGVVTAGAALAHLDLALSVIRAKSPNVANAVARYLLLDDRASQAAFATPSHVAYDDDVVRRFETWTRRNLGERFELATAARAIGASERTLQRRVRTVLGKSPIAFVQDLRLERAVHLLRVTRDSVGEVAQAVGYEDASTLRTLLRRRLKLGIRDLRGN